MLFNIIFLLHNRVDLLQCMLVSAVLCQKVMSDSSLPLQTGNSSILTSHTHLQSHVQFIVLSVGEVAKTSFGSYGALVEAHSHWDGAIEENLCFGVNWAWRALLQSKEFKPRLLENSYKHGFYMVRLLIFCGSL